MTLWRPNQLQNVERGQLWPYTGAHKIYVCPTDAVESKGSKAGLFRQRQVYVSSYVWNGSVNSYNRLPQNRTHKLTLFNATDILQWETDENKPFFFNDVSFPPRVDTLYATDSKASRVNESVDEGEKQANHQKSG